MPEYTSNKESIKQAKAVVAAHDAASTNPNFKYQHALSLLYVDALFTDFDNASQYKELLVIDAKLSSYNFTNIWTYKFAFLRYSTMTLGVKTFDSSIYNSHTLLSAVLAILLSLPDNKQFMQSHIVNVMLNEDVKLDDMLNYGYFSYLNKAGGKPKPEVCSICLREGLEGNDFRAYFMSIYIEKLSMDVANEKSIRSFFSCAEFPNHPGKFTLVICAARLANYSKVTNALIQLFTKIIENNSEQGPEALLDLLRLIEFTSMDFNGNNDTFAGFILNLFVDYITKCLGERLTSMGKFKVKPEEVYASVGYVDILLSKLYELDSRLIFDRKAGEPDIFQLAVKRIDKEKKTYGLVDDLVAKSAALVSAASQVVCPDEPPSFDWQKAFPKLYEKCQILPVSINPKFVSAHAGTASSNFFGGLMNTLWNSKGSAVSAKNEVSSAGYKKEI